MPTPLEDQFADIFAEPPKDDPDRNARALKALYVSPQQGIAPVKDHQTRFFVLGLGPNVARIAIRLFWHVGTVAELSKTIQQHFDDLDVIRPPFEEPHPVFRLLLSIAVQSKSENFPPNLGGDVMRSVIEGLSYPQTLLSGAIRRIRAEQEITYPRAAIIKACINRQSGKEELFQGFFPERKKN